MNAELERLNQEKADAIGSLARLYALERLPGAMRRLETPTSAEALLLELQHAYLAGAIQALEAARVVVSK